MPALDHQGAWDVTTLRGQASYKPQGRKPRHAPMGSEKAKAVWGFDDLRCDAQSGRALRAEGEMAGMQRGNGGEVGFFDDAADGKRCYGSVRQSRPLSGQADEERTLGVSNG